jgi:hypothetical protein
MLACRFGIKEDHGRLAEVDDPQVVKAPARRKLKASPQINLY